MSWFLRIGAGLLLALGLVATAVAATPDGKTAATALPLPSSLTASGDITGNAAGSYFYYTFNYPGNAVTGTVTLTVTPTDPTVDNAVGLALYQGATQLASLNAISPVPGTNSATFSSATAGPVLVEVYNYDQGQAAHYNFAITGFTASAAASPSPSPSRGASTPSGSSASTAGGNSPSTARALPSSLSASGTITGDSAGSYLYYTFNYPGNGVTATVTLNVTPTDPTVGNAVGLNLYQAGTQLVAMNAISPVPGTNSATFSSATAGPVLVEVYNYDQGQVASYNFTITGFSAPASTTPASVAAAPAPSAPAASPAGSSSKPTPLVVGKSVSGTLAGSTAGSYAYYTVDYPGDGSTRTITLSYSPPGIDVGNGVSVSVYQNGATLASASGGASTQPGTLVVTYSSTTKGPVLIQIGNYNPSPTISYTISD